jgi:hypothetical protein
MTHSANRMRVIGAAVMAATVLAGTIGSTAPATAFPRRDFHRGHRGLGVGAAVGLGIGAAALGAVAAGAAARNNYYNGYPVYTDGVHGGYGYDYYPNHGYYGPY